MGVQTASVFSFVLTLLMPATTADSSVAGTVPAAITAGVSVVTACDNRTDNQAINDIKGTHVSIVAKQGCIEGKRGPQQDTTDEH